jgi:hypothetical protein
MSQVSSGAHADGQNQQFSILGVQGTLGTSDVQGTAPTLPIGVNPSTGAMFVQDLSGAGGTTNIQGSVSITGGTFNAGTVSGSSMELSGSVTAGTATLIASTDVSNYRWFSLQMYGVWVGTANLQFSNDNNSWVTTGGVAISSNTNGISTTISSNNIYHGPVYGRYVRLTSGAFTSGTMQALMELYTLSQTLHSQGATSAQSGAWNVTGTIANGSIAVTAGTVGGKAASGAANVANPVQIAGTDSGGTIYSPLINTAGAIGSIANIGTIKEAGTVTGVGTIPGIGVVTTVTNITNGTIQNSGTTTGIGVLSNLTAGSIAVTAGTVGGKAASGAASVANPVQIAGTDGGGTIYSPFITTGGIVKVVDTAGTIASGSVAVTAGTVIVTVGTIGGKAASGAASAANPVQIAGTDAGGTIYSPLIDTAGHLKNDMISGTLNLGTVTMTIGTLNAGTINTGTINAGTIRLDPIPVVNTISSVGTTGTTAIGTLIGTSTIGVGTGVYITRFHILAISGTPEVNLAFGSQKTNNQVIAHGLFPAGGGITQALNFPHAFGTTQSPLTYEIVSGAGTVSWAVDYFLHT